MKRDACPDFHTIREGHGPIHDSLLNWARLVRVSVHGGKPAPMFRHYRSSEVWTADDSRVPVDSLAGWKTEQAVSNLPEKPRAAIRWHYVFYAGKKGAPAEVAHKLAVTQTVLFQLVHDGRSMLKNRC